MKSTLNELIFEREYIHKNGEYVALFTKSKELASIISERLESRPSIKSIESTLSQVFNCKRDLPQEHNDIICRVSEEKLDNSREFQNDFVNELKFTRILASVKSGVKQFLLSYGYLVTMSKTYEDFIGIYFDVCRKIVSKAHNSLLIIEDVSRMAGYDEKLKDSNKKKLFSKFYESYLNYLSVQIAKKATPNKPFTYRRYFQIDHNGQDKDSSQLITMVLKCLKIEMFRHIRDMHNHSFVKFELFVFPKMRHHSYLIADSKTIATEYSIINADGIMYPDQLFVNALDSTRESNDMTLTLLETIDHNLKSVHGNSKILELSYELMIDQIKKQLNSCKNIRHEIMGGDAVRKRLEAKDQEIVAKIENDIADLDARLSALR